MHKYSKESFLLHWQYYCMCSIFAFTGTALVGDLMLSFPDAKKDNKSKTCEEALRQTKMYLIFVFIYLFYIL